MKKPNRLSPPVYEPRQYPEKPKPHLRISHTVNAGGWSDSGSHYTIAGLAWRLR